jgi:hypothetical protein
MGEVLLALGTRLNRQVAIKATWQRSGQATRRRLQWAIVLT